MNRSSQHLLRSCTTLAALLAAMGSQAAPSPDASQSLSRMALREACKDADGELQRALGTLVAQRGLEGAMRIEMELQGNRIGAVSVSGGAPVDQHDVRRAVRRLNCDSGRAERQTVSFEIGFVGDEGTRRAGG